MNNNYFLINKFKIVYVTSRLGEKASTYIIYRRIRDFSNLY